MLVFKDSKKQISPCIAAKVRYALNPTRIRPKNNKRCSQLYWKRVVDTICFLNGINNRTRRQTAIDRFDELI